MQPIADAVDGEVVTIEGIVEASGDGDLLVGPISGKPCLVYEVYDAFGEDEPREHEARDFVVRDGSGKARIRGRHLETTLLGHARREQIQAIDANIHDVSAKLSVLKDRAARTQGPKTKELHAELRRYKRVATLLCAMKAQARGKVHGATMSLPEQARFIERENEAFRKEDDRLAFEVERVEALLAPGQRVVVAGRARWEIDAGGGAGYRQAARVIVVDGDEGAPVRLSLAKEEHRRLAASGARPIDAEPARSATSPAKSKRRGGSPIPWMVVAVLLGMLAYALL